jgi:Domain of unknown function (DUF4442)
MSDAIPTSRLLSAYRRLERRARAQGRMRWTARAELPAALSERQQVDVAISIADRAGTEVLSGTIRIWVTARPER